jgi:outer membrane protein OmpA-like peptidoglycan-associated protein
MLRPRHFASPILLIVLLTTVGLAQDREKIKFLTPTHKGSTGLFNLFVADTLRQGEASVGINGMLFHREPAHLAFTVFPVSGTVGLHDRIELFVSLEAYKRVDADEIQAYKRLNGGLVLPPGFQGTVPAQLLPARLRPTVAMQPGIVAWYNDSPLMDVPFGDGVGDMWAGAKFNILSERRGGPFGFALQPIARFALGDSRERLYRGLTPGVSDAGFDGIVTKNLGRGATLTGNAGLLFSRDIELEGTTGPDIILIDRQHRFNYGVGFEAPLGTPRARLIGEVVGSTFYGSRGPGLGNPRSPVDLYGGLRLTPANWVSISGAYNFNARTIDESAYGGISPTDRHGWFAQLAFHRKINRPPTVECAVDRATVTEGDSATVRVTVMDEDDDTLSVNWRTSGGRLTQQENAAVFDSTGLEPGRYTVTAEVSDGTSTATCTSDITVEKRKLPPTVTCQPGTTTIIEGESATLRAQASDPNNDPLTYTWTVDGQAVPNDQPEFVFGSTGRTIGAHTVRVTVTDVDGMTASCEFTVTINRRPNRPPTVSLSLDRTDAIAGETVTATAQASDPDGDPITYSWTVNGQSRPETGSQLQINTSGMAGGSHTVAVTVRDDRDGVADATQSFSLRERIVIQINRIQPDNVAKARLDEIALKLQQDPRLRATITGYTDDRGTVRAGQRTAQQRADAVKNYLVRQHRIDAGRIETRSGGRENPIADNRTEQGRRQNRRVEIELFVP